MPGSAVSRSYGTGPWFRALPVRSALLERSHASGSICFASLSSSATALPRDLSIPRPRGYASQRVCRLYAKSIALLEHALLRDNSSVFPVLLSSHLCSIKGGQFSRTRFFTTPGLLLPSVAFSLTAIFDMIGSIFFALALGATSVLGSPLASNVTARYGADPCHSDTLSA